MFVCENCGDLKTSAKRNGGVCMKCAKSFKHEKKRCHYCDEIADRKIDGKLVCGNCWDENMCQFCFKHIDELMFQICMYCSRNIGMICNCIAISWCQSGECICKECFFKKKGWKKMKFKCQKCGKKGVLEDRIVNNVVPFVEDYPLCDECCDHGERSSESSE